MTQKEFDKIKIGQRIRVKKSLIPNVYYNNIRFDRQMSKYSGQLLIVKERVINPERCYNYLNCYNRREDHYWSYSIDMLDTPFIFGK